MDKLPSSPAARAFFLALDGNDSAKRQDDAKTTASNNDHHQPSNSFIQKKIQTLGWRQRYSQAKHHPISCGGHDFTVQQVQRGELENTYGTGATVWPASIVLLKYLERHRDRLIQDKCVIDLGAGTGVCSIAAAVLGASRCVCTDGETSVVQLARDNIASAATQFAVNASTTASAASGVVPSTTMDTTTTTNKEGSETTLLPHATILNCPMYVQKYWWSVDTIESSDDTPFDVILVSDCVLPKLYPIAPLVQALDELLPPPCSSSSSSTTTARALLSYEHRYYPEYDPKEKFVELCRARNLHVEVVPMEEQDPVYSVDDIEIWQVTRQQLQQTTADS